MILGDSWSRHSININRGILVPGGFGGRGSEGKISAVNWARTNKIPFLGICYGFQMAVIEFARNVCNIKDATSAEIDENSAHPVIINMPEISKTQLGGTMRLGDRLTVFQPDSEQTKIRKLYQNVSELHERHRHRYEVNPQYVQELESKGLKFVGKDDKGERMIILELQGIIINRTSVFCSYSISS